MPTPDGPQFIPQKYHDWAWEISLRPELDQEYTRTTGEPELRPGHTHFDKEGNPYIASSLCAGRHACPPSTQQMRNRIAFEKHRKESGLADG